MLFGTLLPAYGADAVIFPHAGGRFGCALEECRGVAANLARLPESWVRAMPVPAGGMSVERVGEIVAFYGRDCMLLVGGSLYLAGSQLLDRTRSFVESVHRAGADAPAPALG